MKLIFILLGMCLVSIKLYCPHYLMCRCSNLYHIYNNNYNKNLFIRYSICLQSFCKQYLFVILHPRLFAWSSQRQSSNRNFTQGWLNSYWVMLALSCPFIVPHKQSNERSWSRRFVLSLFWKSIAIVCICAFSQSYCFSLLLIVPPPLMLCALILYISGGTYSLKSTPNDRFLRSFFLLSEILSDICWEEIAEEIFSYFRFDFWPEVWHTNQHTTY